MAPRIPKALIPEPKGFSDPVKRSAAHAERAWETGAGFLGAGAAGLTAAAAAGLAFPPVAPILAAGAAASFYFKLRAKWAKDDPPRPDFRDSVVIPERSIDLLPLYEVGVPMSYVQLVATLESAGDHLGATVEALEKAQGAELVVGRGDEEADSFASLRRREAHGQAVVTSYVLEAVADASETVARNEWLPELPRLEPTFATLGDALTASSIGRLITAGVSPNVLALPLEEDALRSEFRNALPEVLYEGSAAARDLAEALRSWAEDDEGPERSALHPLTDPGGSSPAVAPSGAGPTTAGA
jgi:hypothetical protein